MAPVLSSSGPGTPEQNVNERTEGHICILANQIIIFIDSFRNYIFPALMLLSNGISSLCALLLIVH